MLDPVRAKADPTKEVCHPSVGAKLKPGIDHRAKNGRCASDDLKRLVDEERNSDAE